MIEIEGLKKVYVMGGEQVPALAGISLSIDRGEYVAVIGPSGSGKSTLMNILGGLDRPTDGAYRFEGEDVGGFSDDQLARFRRRRIGFVFQSFQLLPRLTALQNVELPMIYAGMAPRERRGRATELLDRVGLGTRMSQANRPDLLLADEPTGALDTRTGEDVLQLFQDLNADGLTLAIVTHDPGVAAQARRRVAFRDGHIVSDEQGAS